MEQLRHAIIGAGGISSKHFKGYRAVKGVETVALCDANEETLRRTAAQYGISDTYTDYRQLLAREDIDLVSVCLPNYLHAPVTIAALEAGKHVHCEKPMAMSAAQAQAMLDTSRRTGKKLMVALNNRFTPHALYVKGLCDSGWFGDIYFMKCGWIRRAGLPDSGWFGEKKSAGGGALIDLGVHFIDLSMYMMGYPDVASVTAKTYSKFGGRENSEVYTYGHAPIAPGFKFDVDDLACGLIDLKGDASIAFEISWASNIETEQFFYEIYGVKGGARFSCLVERGVKMMQIVDAIYRSSEEHRQSVF